MLKAVVSTVFGGEGIAVEGGRHLVVKDEPEAFAQAVTTLLPHPERRTAYGTAGQALLEAAYSWEQWGRRLLQALEGNFKEGIKG